MDFAEAGLVIGEIAEAEGGRDEIEGLVGEGEAESVGFEEWKNVWRGIRGMVELRGGFFFGADQHGMRKIGAEDAGVAFAREGEGEVAGAAAEIEDSGVGALENGAKEAGGAFAPAAIGLEGEEMIEEVVTRGDYGEHFADFARGVRFGVGAFGAGAWDGGEVIGHGRGESGE